MNRGLIIPMLLAAALAHCGEDSGSSFNSVQVSSAGTNRGAIRGHFLLRLNDGINVDLPVLKAVIKKQVPGYRLSIAKRFESAISDQQATSTRLDKLLKLSIDDYDASENRELFRILKELRDENGNLYFTKVDTDKFLLNASFNMSSIDDPAYVDSSQYYLDMIRWREAMENLTPDELARAVPVVASVFDTGVDGEHEDLAGVLWEDPGNKNQNGYDGFRGRASKAQDQQGHGTAVAGIIGAHGRNGKGIHGAAFLTAGAEGRSVTEIMSVTVLDEKGSGSSDLIGRVIFWAISKQLEQRQIPGREQQKMILNLSLSGAFDADGYAYELQEDGSPVLDDDMLLYAKENDVLIVAAAGNDSCGIGGRCSIDGRNYNRTFYYPCSYSGVLCVAASTHEDRLAGISNHGASVGLTAPGWGIFTTTSSEGKGQGYGFYSGTSEATPLVTAAASLIWSLFPHFSAADIEAILQKSSAQISAIRSEITSGNGRLDLYAALQYARLLTESGVTPAEMEPADVSSTEITPQKAPDLGSDPYRKSSDGLAADNGEGAKESKTKSKLSCGAVMDYRSRSGEENELSLWLMLLLGLPLVLPVLIRRT